MTQNKQISGFADKLDKVFLSRFWGLPIFAGVMLFVFWFTFFFGGCCGRWLEQFFAWFHEWASNAIPGELAKSLFAHGLIGGIGNIIIYLPNLIILFVLLEIIEESGYMARVAIMLAKILRRFGLQTQSIMAILIGFGCSVPGILITRNMKQSRDKIMTMLVVAFTPCSARHPVIVLIAATFFKENAALVVFLTYMISTAIALFMALLAKKLFAKEPSYLPEPVVPHLHFPEIKTVIRHSIIYLGSFLRKVGTVILAGAVIIWFLQSMPPGALKNPEISISAFLGKLIQPIFYPLGFSWREVVALMSCIFAKELIVSSLGTLYFAGENLSAAIMQNLNVSQAVAFLTFATLYVPCIPTLVAIKEESKSWKWVFLAAIISFCVAWFCAFIAYRISILF